MRLYVFEDTKNNDDITVKANTPDVFSSQSEILRYVVPNGMSAILYDLTLFNLKLYSDVPEELGLMSNLWILNKKAGQDAPEEVCRFSYSPFQPLTLVKQMNQTMNEALQVKFPIVGQTGKPKSSVTFLTGDILLIWLQSAAAVSWAEGDGSTLSFDLTLQRQAV